MYSALVVDLLKETRQTPLDVAKIDVVDLEHFLMLHDLHEALGLRVIERVGTSRHRSAHVKELEHDRGTP
jgi:hypothetical protein